MNKLSWHELNSTIYFDSYNSCHFTLAGKWYPYEESIRVPLIIRDPRMPKEKINTLNDDLTLNIDLAPTILGAAGITPPARMQGRDIADLYLPAQSTIASSSLSSVTQNKELPEEHDNRNNKTPLQSLVGMKKKKPWRKEFYYEFPLNNGKKMPMSSAVVRKNIKYIYWPQYDYEQLFDLTLDPLEQNDVANQTKYKTTLMDLRRRHQAFQNSIL